MARGTAASAGREACGVSAPECRLLSDVTAERLEQDAMAVLSCSRQVYAAEVLASAVVALLEDQRARVEMAVTQGRG
jgi:hypothetical protein